jgi:radical SAM protein with 4Fe4S-binding SPASM domain
MYRELKSPVAVQLELTTGCNHKCIHCYNHWRKDSEKDKTLSEDEVRKIIENLRGSEVPNLLITGGEPMLHPDLMIKALELGRKAGLKCSLNSNLTLLTTEIAKELKKLNVGILTSILSYDKGLHDSITTINGSFDRLVEGIRLAKEYEVPVSANMVVMRMNVDQIYETGKFVHGLGVYGFRATKVHPAQGSSCFERIKLPPERIAEIFDNLIRLREEFGLKVDSLTTYPTCLLKDMSRYGQFLSKRNCSAGKTGCTIGADGQLRPCGHSDMVYGNTIEEPILQIWPRLREWRDGSLLPKECKECKYVIQCSGGCRMDCKHYGKIDGMDPYATSKDFAYIPQERERLIPLDPEAKLVVNPALCLRTEKFGTALIIEGSFKSIVTPDTAGLLEELRGKMFTLNSISSEYGVELDNLRSLFANLHKQKVICLSD